MRACSLRAREGHPALTKAGRAAPIRFRLVKLPHIGCEGMSFVATCVATHLRGGRSAMSEQPKKRQPHIAIELAMTFAAVAFIFSTFSGLLTAYAP